MNKLGWFGGAALVAGVLVWQVTTVNAASNGRYAWRYLGTSSDPTMNAGDKTELEVRFKNIGSETWHRDGNRPFRLGTMKPRDGIPPLELFSVGGDPNHPEALGRNRIAMMQAVVAPGEIAEFRIAIKTSDWNDRPLSPGKYRLYFGLVVDGEKWLTRNQPIWWDITVTDETAGYVAYGQGGGGYGFSFMYAPRNPQASWLQLETGDRYLLNMGYGMDGTGSISRWVRVWRETNLANVLNTVASERGPATGQYNNAGNGVNWQYWVWHEDYGDLYHEAMIGKLSNGRIVEMETADSSLSNLDYTFLNSVRVTN
jgi:hypothetical protein